MSGVILRGKATKIVNKGGGRKSRTVKLPDGRHQTLIGPKEKGTDYVVFTCPGCDGRNRQSVYQAKDVHGDNLTFRCNKCLRLVEIDAPFVKTHVILDANSPALKSGLVGPDGRPI